MAMASCAESKSRNPSDDDMALDPVYSVTLIFKFNAGNTTDTNPCYINDSLGLEVSDYANHCIKKFSLVPKKESGSEKVFEKFILCAEEMTKWQPQGILSFYPKSTVAIATSTSKKSGKLFVCNTETGEKRKFSLPFQPMGLCYFPDVTSDILCTSLQEPGVLYRIHPSRNKWPRMSQRDAFGDSAKVKTSRIKIQTPSDLKLTSSATSIGSSYVTKMIALSFTSMNMVVLLNSTGKLFSVFGAPGGVGEGVLDAPMGITCDYEGNILIADHNHNRVVRLTPDGKWGGVMVGKTEGLNGPIMVHYTSHINTTDSTGDVRVYNHDNKYW